MGTFQPPLDKSVGYGVVIGLGFLFAFGMILTTFVLKRYNYELQTSEMFSTAGRTVKSGLVSAAVVSSWTWVSNSHSFESPKISDLRGMPLIKFYQVSAHT